MPASVLIIERKIKKFPLPAFCLCRTDHIPFFILDLCFHTVLLSIQSQCAKFFYLIGGILPKQCQCDLRIFRCFCLIAFGLLPFFDNFVIYLSLYLVDDLGMITSVFLKHTFHSRSIRNFFVFLRQDKRSIPGICIFLKQIRGIISLIYSNLYPSVFQFMSKFVIFRHASAPGHGGHFLVESRQALCHICTVFLYCVPLVIICSITFNMFGLQRKFYPHIRKLTLPGKSTPGFSVISRYRSGENVADRAVVVDAFVCAFTGNSIWKSILYRKVSILFVSNLPENLLILSIILHAFSCEIHIGISFGIIFRQGFLLCQAYTSCSGIRQIFERDLLAVFSAVCRDHIFQRIPFFVFHLRCLPVTRIPPLAVTPQGKRYFRPLCAVLRILPFFLCLIGSRAAPRQDDRSTIINRCSICAMIGEICVVVINAKIISLPRIIAVQAIILRITFPDIIEDLRAVNTILRQSGNCDVHGNNFASVFLFFYLCISSLFQRTGNGVHILILFLILKIQFLLYCICQITATAHIATADLHMCSNIHLFDVIPSKPDIFIRGVFLPHFLVRNIQKLIILCQLIILWIVSVCLRIRREKCDRLNRRIK